MSEDLDQRLNQLLQALLSVSIERGWGYCYAKFSSKNKQSLLVHSVNAFSIAKELGASIYGLSGDDLVLGCLGAFLHDYQKAERRWQDAAISFLRGERPPDGTFDHDDGSEEQGQKLEELLREIEAKINAQGASERIVPHLPRLLNMVVYTHDTESPAVSSKRRNQVGAADELVPLVRMADSIASMKEPKDIVGKKHDLALPQGTNVSFEYHEITTIRGLITSFLNEAIIDVMRSAGYIPIAYFPRGVAYVCVGEPKQIDDAQTLLEAAIRRQIALFQSSEEYRLGLLNAVIGPFTQTKWPCPQLIRADDIPQIVRHLSSMPAMNKEAKDVGEILDAKDGKLDPDQIQRIRDFLRSCGSGGSPDTDASILAKMVGDFYLFVYVADLIKTYGEYARNGSQGQNPVQRMNDILSKNGLSFTLDELSGISHTTPIARKASETKIDQVDTVARLWDVGRNNLHLKSDRRGVLEQRFIQVLREILLAFSGSMPDIFTHETVVLLLADIEHLPVRMSTSESLKRVANDTFQRYLKGKDQTQRVCSFCGAIAEDDAPATLFGDGSQRFSNLLKAGARIGKGYKAQVCPLCRLESTFRAFYFPSAPAATFIVIPDIYLSPDLARQWAAGVEALVRTERLGNSMASMWNMSEVYNRLAHDRPLDNAIELARALRPSNDNVSRLVKFLEDWGDFSRVPYDVLVTPSPQIRNMEDLARAHIRGLVMIKEGILADYKGPTRTQGTACLTPSHMFVFFRELPRLDDEESHSTSTLRMYLLALIIAKVFYARVIVTEGFEPITDLSMEGIVRVQIPPPAERALAQLDVSTEPQLHELRTALRNLAALQLISMSYVKGLGKDSMLRLASMSRGAVLRRSEHEDWSRLSHAEKSRLVALLEVLPSIREDHTT